MEKPKTAAGKPRTGTGRPKTQATRPPTSTLRPRTQLGRPKTGANRVLPAEDTGARAEPVAIIGGYEVLAEIARGGMGVVYKARQPRLDRLVALKVMIAGEVASEDQVKRFLLEARAAARLKHPNIVPIFEVGNDGGQHFFTMEFIAGKPLSARIVRPPAAGRPGAAGAGRGGGARRTGRREPLFALAEIVSILEPVAEAVEYAHSQGIIHRDLKPANILIDERGQPRVADFGLARDVTGGSSLSVSGSLVGTPDYMSPEQARGEPLDPRSDVYALGVILYELATGSVPFQAPNLPALLTKIALEEPELPSLRVSGLDSDFETIVMTCLDKDPARRYRSAAALAADLGRFQRGEPIAARPAGVLRRIRKKISRHKGLVAGTLAVMLAVAVSIGVWQWGHAFTAQSEAERLSAEANRSAAEEQKRLVEARAAAMVKANRALEQQTERQWETVFVEEFDGTALAPEWRPVLSDWKVIGGKVVGKGHPNETFPVALMVLDRPFVGDIRVTVEGQVVPGALPEFALCIQTTLQRPGRDGYFVSMKPEGMRLSRDDDNLFDSDRARLSTGKPTQLCFEREGERLRVLVNGVVAIEMQELAALPKAGQDRIGLYGWNSELVVDRVVVEQPALPERSGLLEMAQYHKSRGKLESTLETAQLILQQAKPDEDTGPALMLRAECEETLGRQEEALASWQELLRKHPRAEYEFRYGAARIRSGQAAESVVAELAQRHPRNDAWLRILPWIFKQIRLREFSGGEISPERIRAGFELAAACAARMEDEQARLTAGDLLGESAWLLAQKCSSTPLVPLKSWMLEFSVKHKPESWLLWTEYAGMLSFQGRTEEMNRAYEQAAKYGSGIDMVWRNWGNALFIVGRLDEAIVKFKRALEIDPQNSAVLGNLGLALMQMNRSAEAEPFFRRATEINPNADNSLANFALCQIQLKQYDAALANAKRAIALKPDSADYQLSYYEVLRAMGREEAMTAVLENATAQKSNHILTWQYLLEYSAARQRDDLALRCAQAIAKLDPAHPDGFSNIAVLQFRLDHFAEAIAAVPRALQTLPKREMEFSYLSAQACWELGRYEEARQCAEQSLAQAHELTGARAVRGAANARLGKADAGQTELAQALEMAEAGNPAAYVLYLTADIQAHQGNPDVARQTLNKALEQVADSWLKRRIQEKQKGLPEAGAGKPLPPPSAPPIP